MGQNAPMEWGKMHQPIPEITKEITKENSINQSIHNAKEKTMTDRIDNNTYNDYMDIVKKNIDYKILREHDFKGREDILDEMLNLIVLNICSNKTYIRVGGTDEESELVKSQLQKLKYEHIQYVDDRMKESTTKKSNIRNYLLTALYNAPTSMNNYYQSSVLHDMYGDKDK